MSQCTVHIAGKLKFEAGERVRSGRPCALTTPSIPSCARRQLAPSELQAIWLRARPSAGVLPPRQSLINIIGWCDACKSFFIYMYLLAVIESSVLYLFRRHAPEAGVLLGSNSYWLANAATPSWHAFLECIRIHVVHALLRHPTRETINTGCGTLSNAF